MHERPGRTPSAVGRSVGRLPRSPDGRRLALVLFALVLGLAWTYGSSLIGAGAVTAYAIVAIEYALYLLYLARSRDPVFARLLLIGLIAGLCELATDAWLVDGTGTLLYASDGPFLLRSPLYMPLAWGSTILQLGTIGHWASQRWALPVASLALAVVGALDIPFYEQMAKGAGWWVYEHTPMLGNAPWYVISTEVLIVASLPLLGRWVGKVSFRQCAALGLALGAWIGVAAALSFAALGR